MSISMRLGFEENKENKKTTFALKEIVRVI